MRPKRILAFLLALLVLAAAACGDDDGGAETSTADEAGAESDNPDETGDGGSEASGDPVEIDHIFGTTRVDEVPERIVALGTQWTDGLLAMGTPPVGYVDDTLGADRGLFDWQMDLMPEESTSIAAADGLPFEKIAALEPDLIVATHYVTGVLDADLMLMLTNGLNPSDLPGFDQLPAVENGAFVETSFDEAIALNTPSPISLRHVLDVIRPALHDVNAG